MRRFLTQLFCGLTGHDEQLQFVACDNATVLRIACASCGWQSPGLRTPGGRLRHEKEQA